MIKAERENHYFGEFGGRYVPEMAMPALAELDQAYQKCKSEKSFQQQLLGLQENYAGRPTPLYFAENLTCKCNGAKIYLKLEGLAHTGAHKINNVLGQALLARAMGKKCLVAETGAGQHGMATAAVAAKMGLACKVFMGEVDIERQYPNVYAMRLHGAEVIPVAFGSRTLKDAVNAALKYWIANLHDCHYLIGSALGPHPYPLLVRDFQSVIGREVKKQIEKAEGRNPDILVACVGGGSNALGLFHPFLSDEGVACLGVEAGGYGGGVGENAIRFSGSGRSGIAQGYKSLFLQDEYGQLLSTHSISAGLDYAGVGPELAYLQQCGRVQFTSVTDKEALDAFQLLCRHEGIMPALESAHALAQALKIAPTMARKKIMVVNVSGRGDKDLFITARAIDHDRWLEFLGREVQRDQ